VNTYALKLGVPARDGVVAQMQLPAFATQQRGRIRQLISPAFVGALENKEGKHGLIIP